MDRRTFLRTAGVGASLGVAGCSGAESTPTPSPTPAGSELRLSVENDSSEQRSVQFTLYVFAGTTQTVETFDFTGIEPGETRTRDPQTLEAGEYRLEIDIPPGLSSQPEWTGRECPVKEIAIRIRENGAEIRNACPDS